MEINPLDLEGKPRNSWEIEVMIVAVALKDREYNAILQPKYKIVFITYMTSPGWNSNSQKNGSNVATKNGHIC